MDVSVAAAVVFPSHALPESEPVTTRGPSVRALLLGSWRSHEKVRFLIVGGWNTVFGYLVFYLLYRLLHDTVDYLVIAVMAHVIAVVNAFIGHRLLVFEDDGRWMPAFLRFNAAQLAVLATGLVGLWFLVSRAHLDPLVAQPMTMVVTIVLGYLAHRHFSFP